MIEEEKEEIPKPIFTHTRTLMNRLYEDNPAFRIAKRIARTRYDRQSLDIKFLFSKSATKNDKSST